MVTVATISAPSSAEVSEWFNVSGIVYESTTGEPISGALVNIYYDGKSLGSARTGVDGDYLDSVRINESGYFELESVVGATRVSRYITITEPEPEPDPPVISKVTISAPSSAEKNTPFTVSGTVKDQYGDGVAGASVALYDNGSHFATVSTNSAGGYSKSTSISSTGIHELAAVSGGKRAYTDITITTPEEPEPPIISKVTISAPVSHVEDSPFPISGRVTDQYGDGVGGITVSISVNGTHVGYATPDSQGNYSRNITITSPGVYTLGAAAGTKSASRSITITEAPAEPPVVTTITISAPSSAEKNKSFTISGTVKDQFGVGIGGASVALYDNGSHFATVTTNSAGGYSKSTSISLIGVHELAARADSITAYRDITIVAPAPETYVVGVAMYEGDSYIVGTLIVDGVRYTGVQYKVLFQVEEGVHIFNVEPPAGYTFVEWQVHEYGAEDPMYTSTARPLSVNIDRDIWIWAEVAVEAIPPVVTTVTIDAPASADAGATFKIEGYVLDQYNVGIVGVTVRLYDNGSLFAATTTSSNGYYVMNTSISRAGVHELAAKADSKWAYRNITIIEVEIPPNVKITSLNYPASASSGEGITISWYVKNEGGNSIIKWFRIRDLDTDGLVPPGEMRFSLAPGGVTGATIWPTMLNRDWRLRAETGYGSTLTDSRNFTITLEAVGIPTTLTLSAPDSAGIGEKFNISGILYETESGIAIPNQPINHSYDGRSLGSSTTGVDGDYLKEVSIPEADTWTLKSEFPGTPGYAESGSSVGVSVAAVPLPLALLIAGPLVMGVALYVAAETMG